MIFLQSLTEVIGSGADILQWSRGLRWAGLFPALRPLEADKVANRTQQPSGGWLTRHGRRQKHPFPHTQPLYKGSPRGVQATGSTANRVGKMCVVCQSGQCPQGGFRVGHFVWSAEERPSYNNVDESSSQLEGMPKAKHPPASLHPLSRKKEGLS